MEKMRGDLPLVGENIFVRSYWHLRLPIWWDDTVGGFGSEVAGLLTIQEVKRIVAGVG